MASDKIPFLDLIASHQPLVDELVEVLRNVLDTASFVGGPISETFEAEFGQFCQAQHCIGVSSGTDAVRFALMAAGVQPGDAVITVPNTFIATTEAITQAGGTIEFVDIDEITYTMDPEKLREYIEMQCEIDEKTGKLVTLRERRPVSAIVPVHLYGQVADMDPILSVAQQYDLKVIEDACQAHGAEYYSHKQEQWMKAGSMGQAAAFSFYPGKNLGACGEGGAITTNDVDVARICRMLREHGQSQKYHHDMEGYNGRLDTLQAGFLSVKLRHLEEWNQRRRTHAKRYDELLRDIADAVIAPQQADYSRSVYHLYVIRTPKRDEVRRLLEEAGIGTGIHYPIPLHLQKAYLQLKCEEGDYPVTERVAPQLLSLPMFPELSVAQQDRVVEVLTKCISKYKAAPKLRAAVAL